MNTKTLLLLASLCLGSLTLLRAQPAAPAHGLPPGGPGPHHLAADGPGEGPGHLDPIRQALLPPELLLHRSEELGLTADQRQSIKTIVREAQGKAQNLQWQMQDAYEVLAGMLKADRVDEAKALAQLDKVQALENGIKRERLAAALRVKNLLTPEQQAKAREMRADPRHARPRGDRPGPGNRGPWNDAPPPPAEAP